MCKGINFAWGCFEVTGEIRKLKALLMLLVLAVALTACGTGGKQAGTFPLNGERFDRDFQPASAVSEVSSSKPILHRAPTWQNTSQLVSYEDYIPNEISILFKDVGVFDEQDSGIISEDIPSSLLIKDRDQALYARHIATKYRMSLLEGTEVHLEGLSFASYRIAPEKSAVEIMQNLLDNEAFVKLVEYRVIRKFEFIPDDPDLVYQWHHGFINSFDAWDIEQGEENVWVAVIDSGVDLTHPDLIGNILPVNEIFPEEDFDLGELDKVPMDTLGHGTFVAGLISAVANNSLGVAGVSPGVKVLPIKISDDAGRIVGDVPTAIVFAAELGARVINMSFGQYIVSQVEREAIKFAHSKNVMMVAAAGNDNSDTEVHFPSAHPEVISVGAVDFRGDRSRYSNYGITVDVVAPGGDSWVENEQSLIYSTYLGGYSKRQGTSASAPMVAGVCALLLSKFGDAYSIDEYRGWVEASGTPADSNVWRHPFLYKLNARTSLEPAPKSGPSINITSPSNNSLVSGVIRIETEYSGEAPMLYKLLYVDGVLQSGFTIDTTDFLPGEHELFVEALDQHHQRAFAESSIVVSDARVFTAPYFSDFDSSESVVGWLGQDFNGAAFWHVHQYPSSQYSFALGLPSSPNPFFTSDDVDWLLSPNISIETPSKAVLRFYGKWNLEEGILVNLKLIGLDGMIITPLLPQTFDGYFKTDVSQFNGNVMKVMIEVAGGEYNSLNSMRIDNFSVTVSTPPPVVSFTSPLPEAHISGDSSLVASVIDPSNDIESVEFYLDNKFLDRVTSPPYRISDFNTADFPNGSYTLKAIAYDNDYVDDNGDGDDRDYGITNIRVHIQNHVLTGVSPTSASWGGEIAVFGSGFNNFKEGAELSLSFPGRIGTVYAKDDDILSWTENLIRAKVPYGAVSGKVWVLIDSAYAVSPRELAIIDLMQDFRVLSPNAWDIFGGAFYVTLPPQPNLDELEIWIAEADDIHFRLFTKNEQEMIRQVIPGSQLPNGKYTINVKAHYGSYTEILEIPIFMVTLPGDFNSDRNVDSADIDFLYSYLKENGTLVSFGHPSYLAHLDANQDLVIDERDASYIGYHYLINS